MRSGRPIPPTRLASTQQSTHRPSRLPRHPYRRTAWTGADSCWPAAALIAIAVGVAAIGLGVASRTGSRPRPVRSAAAAPVVHPRPPAPHAHMTPLTTAPKAQLLVMPTGDARVTVRTPFRLSLRATGPCWVQVHTARGNTVYEGTLQAGQTQAVTVGEPIVVRLGDDTPAIGLVVHGTQLDLWRVARIANVRFQT